MQSPAPGVLEDLRPLLVLWDFGLEKGGKTMGSHVNQTAPNWLKSCCKWASTKVTQPTNVVVKTSVISSEELCPKEWALQGQCRAR